MQTFFYHLSYTQVKCYPLYYFGLKFDNISLLRKVNEIQNIPISSTYYIISCYDCSNYYLRHLRFPHMDLSNAWLVCSYDAKRGGLGTFCQADVPYGCLSQYR